MSVAGLSDDDLIALRDHGVSNPVPIGSQGAYGDVYRCDYVDAVGGKPAAIKVVPSEKLLPHLHEDASMVLAQDCAHVLQMFTSFKLRANSAFVSGRLVIVMELAPHGDLSKTIERRWAGTPWAPRPTHTQVLDIARQLTTGLQNLHQRSLMHRDLKPLNVLVFEGGVLKHADLGLSKQVNPSASSQVHTRGRGTTWYVAPEVAAGLYSARADLYSLGCMLAEVGLDCLFTSFYPLYMKKLSTTDPKGSLLIMNDTDAAHDEMFKDLIIDSATRETAQRCPLLAVIVDKLVRPESRTRASLGDILALLDAGEDSLATHVHDALETVEAALASPVDESHLQNAIKTLTRLAEPSELVMAASLPLCALLLRDITPRCKVLILKALRAFGTDALKDSLGSVLSFLLTDTGDDTARARLEALYSLACLSADDASGMSVTIPVYGEVTLFSVLFILEQDTRVLHTVRTRAQQLRSAITG